MTKAKITPSSNMLTRMSKQDKMLLAIKKDVMGIKEQTMKTNGRVTSLEDKVAPMVQIFKHVLSVWGMVWGAVCLLVVPALGKLVEILIGHVWH